MCTVRWGIEGVSIELTNEQNNEDKANISRVPFFISPMEIYYFYPEVNSAIMHRFKRIMVI